MKLSQFVTIRQFKWHDLYDLVGVINFANEVDGVPERVTTASLHHAMTWNHYNPERDCVVADLPTGRLIGFCDSALETGIGRAWGRGVVHPDFRRRGVGKWLLTAADFCLLSRCREVSEDQSVHIYRETQEQNRTAQSILKQGDYSPAHFLFYMKIDFDEAMPTADLPDGFVLKTFDPEQDARRFYEAHQASFRDHWAREEDMPFDIWEHYNLQEDFDPSLWVMAIEQESGQVAGVVINKPVGGEEPNTGVIGVLGVLPEWRERGLGTTLLWQSFHLLSKKGFSRAVLEVDGDNPFDAVRLYKRAGMTVTRRAIVYKRVLR